MRTIPDPGFAGDDGSADPALSTALAAYDAEPDLPSRHHEALAALARTRVLVPVVAVAGETEIDEQGRAIEKTSDMAAVSMRGADGRSALLAFTCSAALQRWDPGARPVPVTAADAARAARQDGAAALLLDVAGPVMFVVEDDDLDSLAAGHALVALPGGRWAWVST